MEPALSESVARVERVVKTALVGLFQVDRNNITRTSKIGPELNMDMSDDLDQRHLAIHLEDAFEIVLPVEFHDECHTVGETVDYIHKLLSAEVAP